MQQLRCFLTVIDIGFNLKRVAVLMLSTLTLLANGELQVPCYFVFGDSLMDNGNNNYLVTTAKVNYPPYGIDFPDGPTGRFSNGRNTADVIAELLGFKSNIPPFATANGEQIISGVNYAFGAAGIREEMGQNVGAGGKNEEEEDESDEDLDESRCAIMPASVFLIVMVVSRIGSRIRVQVKLLPVLILLPVAPHVLATPTFVFLILMAMSRICSRVRVQVKLLPMLILLPVAPHVLATVCIFSNFQMHTSVSCYSLLDACVMMVVDGTVSAEMPATSVRLAVMDGDAEASASNHQRTSPVLCSSAFLICFSLLLYLRGKASFMF